MTANIVVPQEVLDHYGLANALTQPLGHGLINHTWIIERTGGERCVLQRLNPIFPAAVNVDIDVVTRHLIAKGLETPTLLPTGSGALWVEADEAIWRLLSHVPGVCHNALANAHQAREAGALLGRFHRAVGDLEHDFATARLGVHDTPRHLAALRQALTEHVSHPDYDVVAPLAEEILSHADELSPLPPTPDRIVHGDPKINNIVFDPSSNAARSLIDLDTLGPMPLPLELGDAFRSWCNPGSEDTKTTQFDLRLFAAAVGGYASQTRGFVQAAEWRAIVPATMTILVELAARFCADALNESYFGWDPDAFASRSEHNRVRAAGQLTEFRVLAEQASEAEAKVYAAFAAASGST